MRHDQHLYLPFYWKEALRRLWQSRAHEAMTAAGIQGWTNGAPIKPPHALPEARYKLRTWLWVYPSLPQDGLLPPDGRAEDALEIVHDLKSGLTEPICLYRNIRGSDGFVRSDAFEGDCMPFN